MRKSCASFSPNGSAPQQTEWGGEELLNKVVIFVFFVHKKYFCSFLKLQFNL